MTKYYTLLIFLCISSIGNAQIGRLALSPFQSITQKIAKTEITINYSRPLMRDRIIFGGLVPYGEYWRTGANRNTTIEFDQAVIINDQRIEKGKYAIITKPEKEHWGFMLYDDTSNWHVPDSLEASKIICTTNVSSTPIDNTVKALSISIDNLDNYQFDLCIQWENTKAIVPIQLTTKELMTQLIDDELNGPQAGDYYSAAVYQLESEKNYPQGLEWINQCISIRKDPKWYDQWKRALLLYVLEEYKECKVACGKGLELARQQKNDYGIGEFNRLLKMISE